MSYLAPYNYVLKTRVLNEKECGIKHVATLGNHFYGRKGLRSKKLPISYVLLCDVNNKTNESSIRDQTASERLFDQLLFKDTHSKRGETQVLLKIFLAHPSIINRAMEIPIIVKTNDPEIIQASLQYVNYNHNTETQRQEPPRERRQSGTEYPGGSSQLRYINTHNGTQEAGVIGDNISASEYNELCQRYGNDPTKWKL